MPILKALKLALPIAAALGVFFLLLQDDARTVPPTAENAPDTAGGIRNVASPDDPLPETRPAFGAPIPDASERVSKKPFGLYVRPGDSPVSPERFQGYHSGVDFEAFVSEAGTDVPVFAICDGPLVAKRRASGYGGIAVQACRLNDADITVIYGHLRLSSIGAETGRELRRGERLGLLGEEGRETDGERKHLHLGIHKGSSVTLKGYVAREADLAEWIDVRTLLAPR